MFNGDGTRSRSHGLRPEILDGANRAAGPAADQPALRVGHLRRGVRSRPGRSGRAGRHARRLRRHPVRRTQAMGRASVGRPGSDGRRAALEAIDDRSLSRFSSRSARGRASSPCARASSTNRFWARARGRSSAGAGGARRRSVRRTRRVPHGGDRLPRLLPAAPRPRRRPRHQQRLHRRRSGAR